MLYLFTVFGRKEAIGCFRSKCRDVDFAVHEIENYIRASVWHWRVKRCYANWVVNERILV